MLHPDSLESYLVSRCVVCPSDSIQPVQEAGTQKCSVILFLQKIAGLLSPTWPLDGSPCDTCLKGICEFMKFFVSVDYVSIIRFSFRYIL